MSDGGHVVAITADSLSALAANAGHVFAISAHSFTALAPDGAALLGREIIAPTAVFAFGLSRRRAPLRRACPVSTGPLAPRLDHAANVRRTVPGLKRRPIWPARLGSSVLVSRTTARRYT